VAFQKHCSFILNLDHLFLLDLLFLETTLLLVEIEEGSTWHNRLSTFESPARAPM